MKFDRIHKNLVSNIIVQGVLAVNGIVIPKLIINTYGSVINGMVSTIGQFLMYAGLVEAGIGNAAVIVLFQSISKGDEKSVDIILSEAKRKYAKTGIFYTLICFIIACIYPLFIKTHIEYKYVFSVTVILSLVGIIDYLIIGKYKILLIADNRYYIVNFTKTVATIVLLLTSIWLIKSNASLLAVKGLAVWIHIGEALFIRSYVKVRYPQYSFQEEKRIKFEQQNSALIMQICMLVTYNTDLIVMTFLLKEDALLEISVYSVYALVLSFCSNMMSVLCTGMNAPFGKLYAMQDMETLERRFKNYESIYYIWLFIIYTCFLVLIMPFIKCYAGNVTDTEYIRPVLAVLFGMGGLLAQLKDAHATLVCGGCGAYKEVKKYVIYEAVVNIVLSIMLVRKLGVVGVMFGTVVSHIFVDYGIIKYGCRVLLPRTFRSTISRIARNMFLYIILCVAETVVIINIESWKQWMMTAILVGICNTILFWGWNYLFERNELLEVLPINIKKK